MKKILLLSAYFLVGALYIKVDAQNITTKNDTTINNQLTSQQKTNGWFLLFDGKTLNGWKTFKNEPGSWKAENGMICSYTSDSGHADLITDDMFENFELDIDWKISPEGNSGILYLVTEDYDATYLSGPEYQLIDDDGFPEKIEDWQKTGANYGMQAPSIKAAHKPGEWNTTKIIINKGHVEHWLNGKKVVEYNLWSDAWKQQKANGKWKDDAGYGAAKSGHIALQSSHSTTEASGICFKNIILKKL
jgi:3-keto-disaccharide hydrolase